MSDPARPTITIASVKRACDACHRRKVKCIGDGTRPCKNCNSASLTCTYNAIPQKKGPKGSRAKVISELRESQRQSQLASKMFSLDLDTPPRSPSELKRAGVLSMEMITACVEYYFANLYPTQPILHRQRVGETIGLMDKDIEAYCLVVSLCAYMMIQPNMVLPPTAFEGLDIAPQSSLQLGQILLQEARRVRKGFDYAENPSVWSVITSFFFFGSYFCLDRHSSAWFHLREATTLAQVLDMSVEASYQMQDIIESSRRRRLYWLLFVTERAYALQQHKPLTLHATISLPTLEDDPTETVELTGFLHLVNLYRPFDDTFVGLWNKTRTGCTTGWLAQLQKQLSDVLPAYLNCAESQAVDLRCSQQWLRVMVWQLAISHGFLSSATSDNAMSFRYPIELSRDLVQAVSQFSQPAMEIHGIGLISKLFDVACTLTDVMSVIPQDQYIFELGPRSYLNSLMSQIASLRGGQERYLPLLVQKINETIQQTQGYSASTIPASVQIEDFYDDTQGHSSATTSSDSSPYDSPVSAGAQPFLQYPDVFATSAAQYPSDTTVALCAPPQSYGTDATLSDLHAGHARFEIVR